MKIGALSADWVIDGKMLLPGPTNWWRMHTPGIELKRHGYEIVAGRGETAPDGSIRVQEFSGERHDDCDLIWMQRWLPRPTSTAPAMVSRARAAGQVIVNDIDDYHWAVPTSFKSTFRGRLDQADPGYASYSAMLKASSGITVSSTILYAHAERMGVPTFYCRNAIDIERWDFDGPGGMIGYVGGVPFHSHDLPILREFVIPVLRELGLPFYHGGHDEYRPIADRLGYQDIVTRPACTMVDYPGLWEPLGVALVPLEDSTFNRAKSWCKGLEAFARGIPVIASRLPEYERLGGAVRLAKKRSEWRQHLLELSDPETRRIEGEANRKRAEELSIARQWRQWHDVFSAILPSKAPRQDDGPGLATDDGYGAEDGSQTPSLVSAT